LKKISPIHQKNQSYAARNPALRSRKISPDFFREQG
jgi:hypothetical protein